MNPHVNDLDSTCKKKQIICPNCGGIHFEEDPEWLLSLTGIEWLALVMTTVFSWRTIHDIFSYLLSFLGIVKNETGFGAIIVSLIAAGVSLCFAFCVVIQLGSTQNRRNGIAVYYSRCVCCRTKLRLVRAYGTSSPWDEPAAEEREICVEETHY